LSIPAIRGGGHSVPGFGTVDDGLVIDLSPMKNVRVDPVKKVVRVGGGATWGDVDHATYPFGLAAPGGIISTTGVGGLTLGGGIGYLTRGVGLSIDNLLSADVVLADGRQVTASDYQNEDLFWALRGGGGNFGVVTSFEFQLHEVGDVVGGPMFYEFDDAAAVLEGYREFIADAPEQQRSSTNGIRDSMRSLRVRREPHSSPAFFRSRQRDPSLIAGKINRGISSSWTLSPVSDA
jgi:FAD/FMN-containing dehydrogenase